MARMRTIKPEFWTDDKIVELSLLGRLLFIGLWNFADDDGYIEYSPKRIKRLVFPDQDINVQEGLDELINAGFLCVCDSDQGELLKICQFSEHQRPQHPVRTKFTRIIERKHDDSIVLMRTHEASSGRVEESSVEESSNSSSEIADAITRDDVSQILDTLDAEIIFNGDHKVPSRTQKNVNAARLLIDRDGYTVEQIESVIRWALSNEFWRSNIRSMSKLREQFSRLLSQMNSDIGRKPVKPAIDPDWWMYQKTLEQA